jgi:hypothetical protein
LTKNESGFDAANFLITNTDQTYLSAATASGTKYYRVAGRDATD